MSTYLKTTQSYCILLLSISAVDYIQAKHTVSVISLTSLQSLMFSHLPPVSKNRYFFFAGKLKSHVALLLLWKWGNEFPGFIKAHNQFLGVLLQFIWRKSKSQSAIL